MDETLAGSRVAWSTTGIEGLLDPVAGNCRGRHSKQNLFLRLLFNAEDDFHFGGRPSQGLTDRF